MTDLDKDWSLSDNDESLAIKIRNDPTELTHKYIPLKKGVNSKTKKKQLISFYHEEIRDL